MKTKEKISAVLYYFRNPKTEIYKGKKVLLHSVLIGDVLEKISEQKNNEWENKESVKAYIDEVVNIWFELGFDKPLNEIFDCGTKTIKYMRGGEPTVYEEQLKNCFAQALLEFLYKLTQTK